MKLFEPITIRGMEIKNRIAMAPLSTNFFMRSEQSKSFYVERAEGGVGAITLGATNIDAFFSDRFIKGTQEWVIDPVHEYGVKIGPELWHGNLAPTLPAKGTLQKWVAPSAGSPLGGRSLTEVIRAPLECYCRELTVADIQAIIKKFAEAALRAREAGFDYVSLHGAHGHNLADQFLSPRDNRREDEYGGDLAGRARFSVELARAIRAAIGDDYPFFWRLSAEHGLPGDYTLSEAVEYAAKLVEAGVDVIDVSYGHEVNYEAAPIRSLTFCPGPEEPMGTFIPLAEAFKKKLSVPIIGVGGIRSAEAAEEALLKGRVDLVAVGRQLLADPLWPQKISSGAHEDIRPCICCNNCIASFREKQVPVSCTVNVFLGKGDDFKVTPAEKAKKVLVVGGGPAGMEAALLAAQRGHSVVLAEKGDRLGGALLLVEKVPDKPTIHNLIQYMSTQLAKAGVEIKLGEEATLKSIQEMNPDAVVLATGSNHAVPDIPGLQNAKVATAVEVLNGQSETGDRVAIIGGGLVACDTAEFLAECGKSVTMIEVLPDIAPELYPFERQVVCSRLGAKGVIMISGVKHEEVTDEGLAITDKWNRDHVIKFDSIVIAAGAKPNNRLLEELKGKVHELYAVGDCSEPRKIIDAIGEGATIGLKI